MPQLSASTLKLFQECPRCFWWHINRKIERPRGPFPSLPSGIDRVLKGYFDTYRKSGTIPPLIDGKLEGRLATSALTLGFNDDAVHARLWGKLDDCVVSPDERLAPLDHKTRASAPDDLSYTQKYYQFQMDVYTLLLERNGYPTSRSAYVVYYFPLEGMLHQGFPFGVVVHKVATDPEGAYQIFTDACRALAGPLPEASGACAFCRWAEARVERSHAAGRRDEAQRPMSAQTTHSQRSPRFGPSAPARLSPEPGRAGGAGAGGGTIPDDLFA